MPWCLSEIQKADLDPRHLGDADFGYREGMPREPRENQSFGKAVTGGVQRSNAPELADGNILVNGQNGHSQ